MKRSNRDDGGKEDSHLQDVSVVRLNSNNRILMKKIKAYSYILIISLTPSCMMLFKKPPPLPILYERYSYEIFKDYDFLLEIKTSNNLFNKEELKLMRVAFRASDSSVFLLKDSDTLFKGNTIKSLDGKNKYVFFFPNVQKIDAIKDRLSIANKNYWNHNIKAIDVYPETHPQKKFYYTLLSIFNTVSLKDAIIEQDKIVLTEKYWGEYSEGRVLLNPDTLILHRIK
jgi:hypothetical protein